jgi:hypothetical protein
MGNQSGKPWRDLITFLGRYQGRSPRMGTSLAAAGTAVRKMLRGG